MSWATKYECQPWHQNFLIMDTMPPIYFDFRFTIKYELYIEVLDGIVINNEWLIEYY